MILESGQTITLTTCLWLYSYLELGSFRFEILIGSDCGTFRLRDFNDSSHHEDISKVSCN